MIESNTVDYKIWCEQLKKENNELKEQLEQVEALLDIQSNSLFEKDGEILRLEKKFEHTQKDLKEAQDGQNENWQVILKLRKQIEELEKEQAQEQVKNLKHDLGLSEYNDKLKSGRIEELEKEQAQQKIDHENDYNKWLKAKEELEAHKQESFTLNEIEEAFKSVVSQTYDTDEYQWKELMEPTLKAKHLHTVSEGES